MSAVSKSHIFVPGTDIEAAEVNQNFDDVVNYVNAEAIVRDASKAFTAIPSGPGTDPTSPNQLARKQYVDQHVRIDGTTAFTGIPSGPNSNPTTENQFTRKKYVDDSAVTPLTRRPTINNNATNVKILSQSVNPTTNENGDGTVTFPAGSFTNCISVIASNGSLTVGAPGTNIFAVTITGFTATGFTFRAFKTTSTAPFGVYVLEPSVSAGCIVNYIAVGT